MIGNFKNGCGIAAVCCLISIATNAYASAGDVGPADEYKRLVARLEPWIEQRMSDQGLPAISIALVDGSRIVWSRGFGMAKPDLKIAATSETVHCAGSVSKLFTDIAVMKLVEAGKLDLDAPITQVIGDFALANPYPKSLSLRQLMSHRAGLVREPPVGHYFDSSEPTLAATVASLNKTTLVYPPEARTKYSNAGIAVVGRVLEKTTGMPFADAVRELVLEPLAMDRSGFTVTPGLKRDLADGFMWTYDGRMFKAPTFALGMAPAGSLHTTVNDLARFMIALFAGGKGERGRILKSETLATMWAPPFANSEPGKKPTFGLGFALSELDGRRKVGHGGAVYGFATQFEALPDDKLGAIVMITRDCANNSAKQIAESALRLMLAQKEGKPLPDLESTKPVGEARAGGLAGRYGEGDDAIDLVARGRRLFVTPVRGGQRLEMKAKGEILVVDDCLNDLPGLVVKGGKVSRDGAALERRAVPKPKKHPAIWNGLIGEYGWDYDTLYILEKDEKLFALIEWFFLYPLTQESPDVYAFPDWGLYEGEKLVFHRDLSGNASRTELAGVVFPRRTIAGEGNLGVRIKPLRPVGELTKRAREAKPPKEAGSFRKPDLVDPTTLAPTIKLDIRYATANNFLGVPIYTQARAFLQRPVAEALARVSRGLASKGYGLLIHDAYRPWYITKVFWDATPSESRIFVADPSAGSRHNRGCAVDLTLYELATGKPVETTGLYDEFSTRSYPDYPGGTSLQRWHRELLRGAMQSEGFHVYEFEWWHFDYKDWRAYPILNKTFEEL